MCSHTRRFQKIICVIPTLSAAQRSCLQVAGFGPTAAGREPQVSGIQSGIDLLSGGILVIVGAQAFSCTEITELTRLAGPS